MCPFIVQNPDTDTPAKPQFVTITATLPHDNIITALTNYARTLTQTGKRVLIFDASLGLGELQSCLPTSQNADPVLLNNQAFSNILVPTKHFDLITGVSKSTNLGTYNVYQLQQVLTDLQLLGKNYQTIIVYAPPSLPNIQHFFCDHLDTICFFVPDKNHLSAVTALCDKHPATKYYLLGQKQPSPQILLQLELIVGKRNILSQLF